jgi:RHS repeat-associated protein
MSGVTFPDSSTLSMTYVPNGSGYTTGQLASLTLPTGGTVTFGYGVFNCNYLQNTELTITTSDGTWKYIWTPLTNSNGTYSNVTQVIDPASNSTWYTFVGLQPAYEGYDVTAGILSVEKQNFHSGSNTADVTVTTCYNGNTTNCTTTVPTFPTTQVDTYASLAGMSTSQHTEGTFDIYGNALTETAYDYNGTTYLKAATTYSGCGQSSSLHGFSCGTTISSNTSSRISGTSLTYDTRGDLLTANQYMPGNTTLTFSNTFNGNGTLKTSKDPAGVSTSYTYGDCNGFGLTQVTVGSLATSATYGTVGCDGGVPVTATDANGNVTHFGYTNVSTGVADPYYRLSSVTDPYNNVSANYYAPTYTESGMSFGSSEMELTTELDGYGRVLRTQRQQGPGSSNYDTVSYTYSQSTTGGQGAIRTTSMPCSVAGNVDCGSTGATATQFDYMGRPSTITDSTDVNGSRVRTFTYSQNDVEMTLSPAPPGENTKSVLMETNGLGMQTIACPIVTSTLPAGSSCGANTAGTGYPLTNAITSGTGTFTTTTTLGSQTRTKVFDAVGRITSETYPESGTTTYYYDSQSPSCTASNGRLTEKKDAKGNILCYSYDSYGRLSKVAANGTLCHLYFYDNSTGFSGTIPNGPNGQIVISNPLGHMVEAATSNCLTTLITDEWFSYDSLGRVTNEWELTPHSTVNGTHVYYQATETYNANGVPATETFAGIDASNTVVTYGIDGEGRWTSAEIGSASEITSVAYNAAQQPTLIEYPTGGVSTTTAAAITAPGGGGPSQCNSGWGSQGCSFAVTSSTNIVANDNLIVGTTTIPQPPCNGACRPDQETVQVQSVSGNTVYAHFPGFRNNHAAGEPVIDSTPNGDTYTYASNTGLMTQFSLLSEESGGTLGGTLSWSKNGTLEQLAITDSFNSGGTQTCVFQYDDLVRLASDLCGTGSSSYRSTMAYDQYDNITKSSSNGTAPTWPQSGSYSSTTNQLSSSTYDANGSTLTDYFHAYAWDGFNRMSTLDSNTMTYDALGNVVEVANGGTYTVFENTPIGSKIIWNQSNLWTRGHLPMPGGTSLDWTPPGTYIHHKDWLGSSRITTVAGLVYTDKAFGAFGEDTAQDFGPAVNFNYAGDTQDIATAEYDTPNREYMPYQGRWPNVDPSHSGWNGYAFAGNNPISFTDPSGLYWMVDEGADCIGNGCSTMGGFNFGGGFGSNGWAGSVINLLGGNWAQGLWDAAYGSGTNYTAQSGAATGFDFVQGGQNVHLSDPYGNPILQDTSAYDDGMLVFISIAYGSLISPAAPPVSQYLSYLVFRPWSAGIQFPLLNKFVGPAFQGAVNLSERNPTVCGGVGGGIGFRGGSVGPLWGSISNADKILNGVSVSFNFAPPFLAGLGAQLITDGKNGTLFGPTGGTPNLVFPVSMQVTYSKCTQGQ